MESRIQQTICAQCHRPFKKLDQEMSGFVSALLKAITK